MPVLVLLTVSSITQLIVFASSILFQNDAVWVDLAFFAENLVFWDLINEFYINNLTILVKNS